MTNLRYPSSSSTMQKVFNILVNNWQVCPSKLWETIMNIYPYGIPPF